MHPFQKKTKQNIEMLWGALVFPGVEAHPSIIKLSKKNNKIKEWRAFTLFAVCKPFGVASFGSQK